MSAGPDSSGEFQDYVEDTRSFTVSTINTTALRTRIMCRDTNAGYSTTGIVINVGDIFASIDEKYFFYTFIKKYPEYVAGETTQEFHLTQVWASLDENYDITIEIISENQYGYLTDRIPIAKGKVTEQTFKNTLLSWGININSTYNPIDASVGIIDTISLNATYTAPTAKFQVYIEGYGGENHLWSPIFTVNKAGWNAYTYDFLLPGWDVYRFGVKIVSGDALFDTPTVYLAPVEGDYWDLGIKIGTFPSDVDQISAGWLKNRITPTYEWKKAKEALLDLSNMDSDNFWYEIDKEGFFNLWIDRGSKEVEVFLSYPKNITSMEISTNADDIVNFIKGDGSAEVTQDPLVSGVENSNGAPFTWIADNEDSMKKYWALAEAVRYDSERTITALQNDLLSEITIKNNLQDVPTVKIENNAVTPDEIGLGNIVSVETSGIPYVQNVNGLYKIIGYDIRVDSNGNESISLTLLNPNENQINSLTFPQLVKNLINRLHGAR